ncbi:hypothetical protein [Anaerostipes faecalis]|uniref:hypothetical protein n=1 Tax=Anaerostipes faecalis TaxID=2738446 RepID=UPI001C1E4D87|nr:hypothetical protein [Anaerostipes faecalis]
MAAEMRQIGAGKAEDNYDFTTTEERTVKNVKVLIRTCPLCSIVPINTKYYSDNVAIIPIMGYIIN